MSDSKTPDWLVERIALGELAPDELEKARGRLLAEEGGAERLAALQRSNEEILSAHPVARVSAEVARRARKEPSRPRWSPLWLAAPMAASLAVWMVVMTGGEESPNRIKGQQPALVLHRNGPEGAVLMTPGDSARPGELLQLGYRRAGHTAGVVFSIDGAGVVTRHLPESGSRSALLEGSGLTPLPHAYELDSAPDFERFFLVTADSSFEVEPVLAAARELAKSPGRARLEALPLPSGLAQTSLLILKVNR